MKTAWRKNIDIPAAVEIVKAVSDPQLRSKAASVLVWDMEAHHGRDPKAYGELLELSRGYDSRGAVPQQFEVCKILLRAGYPRKVATHRTVGFRVRWERAEKKAAQF